jgi:hypothetical protein
LIETALVGSGFEDPREAALGSTNAWGDHIGHTAAQGAANAARLATMVPFHETAEAIMAGDGTLVVREFIGWAADHAVLVVGGLPAGFADQPIPDATQAAIRGVFLAADARFIELPEQYPRSAFFDTPDHLNEAGQIEHSRAVAAALAAILVPATSAPATVVPGQAASR